MNKKISNEAIREQIGREFIELIHKFDGLKGLTFQIGCRLSNTITGQNFNTKMRTNKL